MGQPVGNTLQARMGNRPQRRFGRRVRVVRRRVFDLLGRFPGAAAAYDVGRSTPGEIPYILPGPQDGWAGNGNGSLLIRFGADAQASRAEMRLTLYLVESQASSPPTIEISAGGFRTSVQAPAGDDINYPDTKRTSARGLAIEALLPAGTFGAGKTSSRSAMPAAAGSSGTPSSSKPTAA